MTKIIIVFCEGQHDIAFLSKVLFVDGFIPYKKKIKDFIKPLNKQYEIELSKKEIADKKLGFQSEYMVPSVALHKDENTLVLLHNLNGDGKATERNKILSMYQNIQSDDDDFTNFNLNFRFLYFFDADDKGIQTRVNEINSELNLSDNLEHNKINTIDLAEWGCYVFHKDEDSGDLEDILLDLMKPNNEDIFINSQSYLTTNNLSEDRQKEFICNDIEEKYDDRIKFKEKKSLISIAGQLQFSSMNNSVIIAKSDYIKKSDISTNSHCVDISKLFEESI
jgi:hypothetical protein